MGVHGVVNWIIIKMRSSRTNLVVRVLPDLTTYNHIIPTKSYLLYIENLR